MGHVRQAGGNARLKLRRHRWGGLGGKSWTVGDAPGELPGIGRTRRREQLGHHFDLQIAMLQLPLIVLLEQHRPDQSHDRGLVGEDADDTGEALAGLSEQPPSTRPVTVELCTVFISFARMRSASRAVETGRFGQGRG